MLCLALMSLGSEFVSGCLCLGEVVAGSQSRVDMLRLSVLVATKGEM